MNDAEIARDALKSLRRKALTDGDKLILLGFLAKEAMRGALDAAQKAKPKETRKLRSAWRYIADALLQGVTTLNQCVAENPGLFRQFAGQFVSWPVVKTAHAGFAQSESDERVLFEMLRIAAHLPLKIRGAKWNPKDEAGCIVLELWQRMEQARTSHPDAPFDPDEGSHESCDEMCFRERARTLPDFAKEGAWLEWWKLAQDVVKAALEDPHESARLTRIVTAKSKLKSKGRIRARLMDVLKDRFKSMAGANKSR